MRHARARVTARERKKRRFRILVSVVTVLFAAVVLFAFYAARSHSSFARHLRTQVKTVLTRPRGGTLQYDPISDQTEKVWYVNNRKCDSGTNSALDNKLIEKNDDFTRLTDFCTGFSIELPGGMEPDFSMSPEFVKMSSDFCDVTISRERSPYEDVDEYIAYYLNRFITNEDYQKNNGLEVLADDTAVFGENSVRRISVRVSDMPKEKKDVYTFATIHGEGREFFRLMFRFRGDRDAICAAEEHAFSSFAWRDPCGTAVYDLSFTPKEPKFWAKETKNVYESLRKSDRVSWGIFSSQVQELGIDETIPKLEKELDFEFPIVLIYNHIGQPIPDHFFEKCGEQGRMIELTLQMTETNNEDLCAKSPLIATYQGRYDDKIRALARELKEKIKTPFFFRLNNEMNSDWANYSGIVNLSDPEIYIGCWRRVYEIFEEEGVDHAIWVYNPNDRDYPPCRWNHFLAYYPGDDYVQVIGVTGYNTGTYYKDVTGEDWRSFAEIYDEVKESYEPFFADFPWMITEFASSSVGGNKPLWIRNMFRNFKNYPNIKAAVWFSAPDMDPRPGHEGQISRPYTLEETAESLDAFREGLKKSNAPNLAESRSLFGK